MAEEFIPRSEAWKIIQTGQPFNLDLVTADRRRGTGGEYIELRGWKRLQQETAEEARPGKYQKVYDPKKNLRHREHKTFIAFNPANAAAHPITVHFRLMQFINDKRITNG